MNPKVSATLEKVFEDRRRSNFKKALSRLENGIDKFPDEFRLHTEAIDVSMEAGESLNALQFFKRARQKFPDDEYELWSFTAEKVGAYNDPIVGKYLIDHAMKTGELSSARAILENLKEHTAAELLQHIRTKKQTHASAVGGGFAAGDELFYISITESLACLRLNRFPEAMDGFVRVLDEKPSSYKLLEPFLSDLEKCHAEKGEASFALGCCYLAGAKYSKGFHKLIRAAKIAPSLAPDAIARIDSLEEDPDIPIDERELRLAELYLEMGENHRAIGLLRSILGRDPARAADIVDVVTSSTQTARDDLAVRFLSIDAALVLGRTRPVIAELREIHRAPEHRTELFTWLEMKSKNVGAPVEILLFFGEIALEEKMAGKAIELFKEILSNGPQEEPVIKELLSRHRSVPLVRHYYNERFGASQARERASLFEFQTYENIDLLPRDRTPGGDEAPDKQAASSPPTPGDLPDPSFSMKQFSVGADGSATVDEAGTGAGDFDNHDFSLRMHESADSRGGKTASQPPDGGFDSSHDETIQTHEGAPSTGDDSKPTHEGSDLFEYLRRDFSGDDPVTGEQISVDSTDRVDDGVPSSTVAHDSPVTRENENMATEVPGDPARVDPLPREDDVIEFSDDPSDSGGDFDSRYQSFLDGNLDGSSTLELIDEALITCRWDEMRNILAFQPSSLGEEIRRKRYVAEYYLAVDRPLPALITLKSISLPGLDKSERKEIMLRVAVCYEAMFNFEAAHSVYLRIIGEHPGTSGIEQKATSNYEKYVQKLAGAAPILEKVTSL